MPRSLFQLEPNKPQVMGVLNVTPDSFSDGGNYYQQDELSLQACVDRAEQMLEQGAAIIDIGGESTRPGAEPVSIQQEIDRVLPVVEALQKVDAVISIDSSSAALIEAASHYDVGLINDVRALQREGALEAAAKTDAAICLMHMQGQPKAMQDAPSYGDVVEEVKAFFVERVSACEKAGIVSKRLLLDPGFGFGKRVEHNVRLLSHLEDFADAGLPLLVGMSRKSMIDHMLGGKPVEQRLAGSVALAVLAVERGAWIVRAHDIQETSDALNIAYEVLRDKNNG